jgi:hypothetical protein
MTIQGAFELLLVISGLLFLVGTLYVGCADAATSRAAWINRGFGLVFFISLGAINYYN